MSALELFSTRGYEATSVREICEAAEITKPTLYHFYGSKEGVYRALVDGALGDFRAEALRAVQGPGTAVDHLKAVARSYFANARGRRDLLRFIFGLIHNPPSSAPATDFPKFYEEMVGYMARDLEAAVQRGELAPGSVELRMLVAMGAMSEAVAGYLVCGRPEPTDELADALVETVVDGWRRGAEAR